VNNVANIIIDGNHLFYRAFEINENKLRAKEPGATDLGAVYIALTSIRKRLQQFKFRNAYITWDKPVFRGTHYRYKLTNNTYKLNRKPKPEKFYGLLDKTIELTRHLGVKTILPYRLEADDVVAYLSMVLDKPCLICTGDNDLLQLLRQDGVGIYNIIKEATITKDNILSYYPVTADNVIRYKAIAGDTGDNISGIKGYGDKTKSIMRVFENYDAGIKNFTPEQIEKIKLNQKLVSLGYGLVCEEHKETEIPFLKRQLEEQKDHKPDYDKFFALAEEYGFDGITNSKGAWKGIVDRERVANILTEMFKSHGK
jgi:5'-3' exonuclease